MIRTTTILFVLLSFSVLQAQPPRSYTSSEILLQLKKLNTVGSVLYIAAHPDDENTRLIAYLANEKCLRTGYLSLTRGDGGQNLIGPEQGVELGVIRTQELLAARRIDGGEQFFTRAYDFGYSKTPEETFKKWNKDSVLSDVVWVIRNFRPDIIITRFATDGSGGHGHHTASAILAEEAFDAAGDPKRFPEHLQYVDVWQPRRLFWNVSTRFANPNADMSAFIKLDVGGYNPLLGKSYGEIAAESRSMHKSQGFGSAKQRGEYFEYFKPVKGDTAGLKDIFEGMDFSWKRVKGGGMVEKSILKTIQSFNPNDPFASYRNFTEIGLHIKKTKTTPYPYYHGHLLDNIWLLASGVFIETTSKEYYVSTNTKTQCYNIRINRNHLPSTSLISDTFPLYPNEISSHYWLKEKMKDNLYTVHNKQLLLDNIATTTGIENSVFCYINGEKRFVRTPYVFKWVDPEKGELYRPLIITPPIMINVNSDVAVFDKSEGKEMKITLKAGKDSVSGTLKITAPQGWLLLDWRSHVGLTDPRDPSESLTERFFISKKNQEMAISFVVLPNEKKTNPAGFVQFSAIVDGKEYAKGIKEIKYDHIPIQTLFPEAEIKLIRLDVKKKLKRIGYIPGAGDEVAPCLTQLGYEVVTITDDILAKENLSQFEAILTGVRAYNTNEKLPSFKQKLMDYVANGGNLIVQYNTNSWAGPLSSDIGPYKFKITRDRITDEEAKVNFELPNHPVLNTPNKITDKDFEGWIQERSIYHAGDWDSNYVAPLSMADPGEKNNKGALIIAKHGKGHFVYSGLVFFRQLPAGVPGAYRLLVNMIELGK